MDETRLKSLYRRSVTSSSAALTAEDLGQALTGSAYPDQEGTVLDRIAGSSAHADLLRTAMALRGDAEVLSRGLREVRTPARRPALRRWVALAAGVGAAAILVLALRPGVGPNATIATQAASDDAIMTASFEAVSRETIMAASFEPTSTPVATPAARESIFDGGFDS